MVIQIFLNFSLPNIFYIESVNVILFGSGVPKYLTYVTLWIWVYLLTFILFYILWWDTVGILGFLSIYLHWCRTELHVFLLCECFQSLTYHKHHRLEVYLYHWISIPWYSCVVFTVHVLCRLRDCCLPCLKVTISKDFCNVYKKIPVVGAKIPVLWCSGTSCTRFHLSFLQVSNRIYAILLIVNPHIKMHLVWRSCRHCYLSFEMHIYNWNR